MRFSNPVNLYFARFGFAISRTLCIAGIIQFGILFQAHAIGASCFDLFSTETYEIIGWRDLKNVETFSGDIMFSTSWGTGWIFTPGYSTYGRGTLNRRRVFFKSIDPEFSHETELLIYLNSRGLGPELIATFEKYRMNWVVTDYVEGAEFRLNYEYGVPQKDGTGYAPHPANNSLKNVITAATLAEVDRIFSELTEANVAAHDFQLLIAPDGTPRLIDVARFEHVPNAKAINRRIQAVVRQNLQILLNGNEVPEADLGSLL